MVSHYQTEYRKKYLRRAGMALAAMKLPMELKGFSLATLENHSTLAKCQDILQTLSLYFSLPKPDSLMSLSLFPRTFGHLPASFGRFLASDLCLKHSWQALIVSPRSKSKPLASYLPSGGIIGKKRHEWFNEEGELGGAARGPDSVCWTWDMRFDFSIQKPRIEAGFEVPTEEERRAFEAMLRSMLKFRPEERTSAHEALNSEWMKGWGQPALEGSWGPAHSAQDEK